MEKFAYRAGYSDCEPFEVVRIVKPGVVELRAMKAERLHKFEDLGFVPGGFVGHCASQDKQKWDIQPDPDAPIVVARLSRAKAPQKAGKWFDKYGQRYVASEEPYKFYDFNF